MEKDTRSASKNTERIFIWLIILVIALTITYLWIWAGPGDSDRKARDTRTAADPVELPVPLLEFPLEISGWKGEDSEIPATTASYMRKNFVDDFVSRRYINQFKQAWADVYVVYCSTRPASILGHRPRVRYKGGGWILDSTQEATITSVSGRDVPCLIHRFHKSPPNYQETVVLNFYVANGNPTADADSFLEELGRRANTERDYRRYVSQIQISSTTESNIRQAATDMVDRLLDFLPKSSDAP
jgi:hypothetical protein